MKCYSISLGCPKNRVDTERLLGVFGPALAAVDSPGEADLVLVNTCGFIQPAVEESVSTILELAETLADMQEGERPVLAVAGCLVSRYGAGELGGEIPEVDLWLSTRELHHWPRLVGEALREKGGGLKGFGARALSTGPSYAYLKIAEGCGHKCAFCTIPSIRGGLSSERPEKLVSEALALLDQGVKEIVLVAQDLTTYGRDLGEDISLLRLVESLSGLPGLAWLRLMYLYPAGLSGETLSGLGSLMGEGSPLLPYFDVPLQHAHPAVLKAMGRPFAGDPSRVLDRIRKHVPGAALRTSLIVGFPGEGEEEFRALEDFVASARFHHLGVFPFWPEDGTRAAELDGQVDDAEKLARKDRIMAMQAGISREILAEWVGEELDVLVEAPHPEWPGLFLGRAWFQAPEVDGVVYVSGESVAPGDLVRAEIDESHEYDLTALA